MDNSPRFVCCERCMGHGRVILAPGHVINEVFCQADACEQVEVLFKQSLIDEETGLRLFEEIRNSRLPAAVPEDVIECIDKFVGWEIRLDQHLRLRDCSKLIGKVAPTDDDDGKADIDIDSQAIIEAVHRFLIASPDRGLGLQ